MAKEFKIYTKTGDKGETSLIGGSRVPKYHLRIESYGTLDELNSFIGLLKDYLDNKLLQDALFIIQERVFILESLLATEPGKDISRTLPSLKEEDISFLESEIDRMNLELPDLCNFIIPGGHPHVSLGHVCRTVCRRAERLVIRLSVNDPVDEIILKYLNRLSDYFFVLARYIANLYNVKDVIWDPEARSTS
jgi:cob(I)alamin adenosyltransferase